jgi:hypothetical protein
MEQVHEVVSFFSIFGGPALLLCQLEVFFTHFYWSPHSPIVSGPSSP